MPRTLVRFDPFREVAALQNDMSRLLGAFRDGNGTVDRNWVPALDVWETDREFVYAFDLPGIPEDKINIEFEDGVLTVSAERERSEETKNDRFYRFERRFGSFARTLGLPQGVGEGDISATQTDGVLEIHVKKPEEVKPRRIQIGVGNSVPSTIEGTAGQAHEGAGE
jgi:HSP20 family protein